MLDRLLWRCLRSSKLCHSWRKRCQRWSPLSWQWRVHHSRRWSFRFLGWCNLFHYVKRSNHIRWRPRWWSIAMWGSERVQKAILPRLRCRNWWPLTQRGWIFHRPGERPKAGRADWHSREARSQPRSPGHYRQAYQWNKLCWTCRTGRRNQGENKELVLAKRLTRIQGCLRHTEQNCQEVQRNNQLCLDRRARCSQIVLFESFVALEQHPKRHAHVDSRRCKQHPRPGVNENCERRVFFPQDLRIDSQLVNNCIRRQESLPKTLDGQRLLKASHFSGQIYEEWRKIQRILY